jgi:hypothetical protein
LIRHACLAAAAVLLLPVAMILPAFGTLLMPAVGVPSLLEAGGVAALGTAITLSAITVFTDPEHGVTPLAATNPLTQNHFAVNRHAHRRAGTGQRQPIMSG